ncbi:MAG: hypothetical protein RLZ14_383 [Actinomycetota bacterium]|jgi:hypothetical protein
MARRQPSYRTSDLAPWVPAQRRLVLVDIENVVGGSSRSACEVERALHDLQRAVGHTEHDVWVTACGPALCATAMCAFSSRVLLGRGIDGADQCLLEQLSVERVRGRFASVALASGDARAFAQPVARLAAAGIPTDVFIGSGYIGASLYRVARSVNHIRTAARAA